MIININLKRVPYNAVFAWLKAHGVKWTYREYASDLLDLEFQTEEDMVAFKLTFNI